MNSTPAWIKSQINAREAYQVTAVASRKVGTRYIVLGGEVFDTIERRTLTRGQDMTAEGLCECLNRLDRMA